MQYVQETAQIVVYIISDDEDKFHYNTDIHKIWQF